ncbi:AmmeMemoRadiSam system radical SAM enzyme [Desulfovibrio intestinalis]|uniref:Pyruvate formate lyase activating enzyme n=1 Tax=Desulfovibrio intestinalis TaxID=58621 RepID=A0A7W8C4T1_9BACT|nr:AmmeMemoRadiSam system radical SAM enzyme [Desulfovibrio intestinalis]MBB5144733.1 pyruvate formate lyase activating enzyme [Desulfovibrio intestinalis]
MQALLWHALDGVHKGSVQCRLCAQGCRLKKGDKGLCGVRANMNGNLVTLVGDVVTAINLDPVEKKPLYHFLPGTKTFSIGSAGCNFTCKFCQNSNIAHIPPSGIVPGKRAAPEDLVVLAQAKRARSMAFTYNEPTVFFELAYETAGLATPRGIRCLLVTNGYMSEDCLLALSRRVCAANVDLKSFRDSFYRQYCGARLQPVLDNLKAMRKLGWWLEVTTLVIPGVNDSAAELKEAAAFIHHELGAHTPWHLSAFHGAHQMADHPSTPLSKLEEAWSIGRQEGLHFVYIGNALSAMGSNTFCPQCGIMVIERQGYSINMHMQAGAPGVCPSCHTTLPGVWT